MSNTSLAGKSVVTVPFRKRQIYSTCLSAQLYFRFQNFVFKFLQESCLFLTQYSDAPARVGSSVFPPL